MSLTACLITKNEERWIAECIDHLKPIVKEFIVIDTGSTDRTKELARERGARVSSVAWDGDFAKARNASLDKATGSWILVVDPDERLAEEDLQKLSALTKDSGVMAYSFNSRNYSENTLASGFTPCKGEYKELESSYPGYFESRKVRLFQNIPSIRFQGSVHELVESTITGKIVESDIPFHHYGSTAEVKEQKNKKSFYQKQSSQKAKEEPSNWKAHYEMGVEWLGASEYQRSVKSLEEAYKLNPKEPLVLSNLGYAYMESGQHDKAEKVLKECLAIDAKNHDAFLNLGVTEMRRKHWQEAIDIFNQLVKIYPHSFMAFRNAGNCFARLKKLKEAANCFNHAVKIFPDFHDAKIDLGIILFAAGKLEPAEALLTEGLKKVPDSLRARAVLDDLEKAKKKLQQGAQKN